MAAHNFATGTLFDWNGKLWEIIRTFPDKTQYNLEASETGEVKTVSYAELVDALFAGALYFAQKAVHEKRGKPIFRYKYTDLHDAPVRIQLMVKFRLWVIQPLLDLDNRTTEDVKARVREVRELVQQPGGLPPELQQLPAAKYKCSITSIYRWIGEYEKYGRDRRALIDRSEERGGGLHLEEEINNIIMETLDKLYLCRTPEKTANIWHETCLRVDEYNETHGTSFKPPSQRTIIRRIQVINSQKVITARQGKRTAQRYNRQYRKTMYPTEPLTVVEIDDTRLDLIVIDDNLLIPVGRPTLVYCMDRATRYPLGFYLGFEPSSYLTAMECLYHVIVPKGDVRSLYGTKNEWIAYGLPDMLVMDNAFQYTGADLEHNAYDLGITVVYSPAGYPEFKAGVERFFKTSNEALVHTVPGTTFSNILKRGDYESKKLACVTLSDFNRILHRYLLDHYAENYHYGLDGIPARCWEDALNRGFFPRLPANLEEPRILLGRVAFRKPQSSGISLHSLYYNSSQLGVIREHLRMAEVKGIPLAPGQKPQEVKIKYHPANLSSISVYDPLEKKYFEIPAKAQDYTNELSLWQHKIIRRQSHKRRQTTNIRALAQTKREIREEIEQSKALAKLAGRTRISRFETGGKSANQQSSSTRREGDQNEAGKLETNGMILEQYRSILENTTNISDDDWQVGSNLPSDNIWRP
jgi:putative transposase